LRSRLKNLFATVSAQSGHTHARACQIGLTAANYRAARAYPGNVARPQLSAKTCRLKRRSAVSVQAMGYFCVGTSKLDDWTSLAIGQLGLQAVDRGGPMRAFRMDDRKQRLIVDGGLMDGERFFGWEVADATALDTLAARLERAGVAVRREIAVVADQRCAAEVISFH